MWLMEQKVVQVLQGYPAKRWGELEFGCKRSDSEAYTIKSMPNCLYDFLEKKTLVATGLRHIKAL